MDETAAPAISAPAPAPSANLSLYVGDLHPEVTEANLFEKFSEIGPLTTIRVCRDSVTRRSLGYAYVNFVNPEDADRAFETMNCEPIHGKPCRIMWSQRDPSLRRAGVGNIFIKNLHKDIDNKNLFDTFGQFGRIMSCKVVTNADGSSRGYGFVHYESQDAADQAIAKVNGMLLHDQKVFVGPFVSRQERLEDQGKAAQQFTNVFVKNLPDNFTDEQLETMFGKFGKITSRAVCRDQTHTGKLFAFVAFEDPEAAQRAVETLNDQEFEGRQLFVGRAQSKSERQAMLRREHEKRRLERQSASKNVNLFVKNLDPSMDDDRFRTLFSEFGTITSAVVMRDEKGVSKGFGFVCFSDSNEAMNAQVNMNKRMVDGKPLYVGMAQRREERKQELNMARMQSMRAQMPMPGPYMQQMNYMAPMPRGYPYAGPRARYPGPMMGAMMQPPPFMRPMARGGQPVPRGAGPRGASTRGGPQTRPRQPQAQFRQQARNLPPQQVMPPAMAGGLPAGDQLTLENLAEYSDSQRKQVLGERLFPLVLATQGERAPKITGMLLEMDTTEVLHMLDDPAALQQKILEAVSVLEEHQGRGGPSEGQE